MNLFYKAAAATLIAVILSITVGKQEKDIATLLSLSVCCMVAAAAITFIQPVLDFLWELESSAQLKEGLLSVLLKCVGIALIAELTSTICSDAGNDSLGKIMHILASAVILYLSIPIITTLLTLIRQLLGDL